MSALREPGRYVARCMEWEISSSRAGYPVFVVRFHVSSWWDGSGWKPYLGGDNEIAGYFYLVKNDGTINEFTIRSLSESLGWDGLSFAGLAAGEWGDCQIEARQEQYKGTMKIKVAFINHIDYRPSGSPPLEKEKVAVLDAKYGPGLRKISRGGKTQSPVEKAADLSIEAEDIPF